jgi:hypothetical protein
MEDITNSFETYFDPTGALVFYQSKEVIMKRMSNILTWRTVYPSIRIPLP